ncbi:MAG: thioredoxin domain-containing protein [Cyanobium sp. Prado107]|nr:thioredoxin domain-containing protein [Cyanobium sp. Prado107]
MSTGPRSAGPGWRERQLLLAIAAVLAVLVVWLRGGLQPQAPLEALARRSPELSMALADGRPTLVEFYADWCEACRSMAPSMEAIERERRGELDVVLLNVDNPRWQPELERYAVNGIPHLELFDAGGGNVGHAIGARTAGELETLTAALLGGEPLPRLAGVGAVSRLDAGPAPALTPSAGPRSHG